MKKYILCFFVMLALSLPGKAEDIYGGNASAGSGNGDSCANQKAAATFFNNAANWGGGAGEIDPGDTFHLCGTMNATSPTASYLQFQTSGTSGNPITLKFETGAIITAAYYGIGGYGISASGVNYIAVDGGTNGIIQATANGTNLANQQDYGNGINFSNVSNSEIKNLTIQNLYVHAASPNDIVGGSTYGIYWLGGSNNLIHNNTMHDEMAGIFYIFPGSATTTGLRIYANHTYNCNWGITVGSGGPGEVLTDTHIYGNTFHDWSNWAETSNNYFHHDGIFVFSTSTTASITGLQIYSNIGYGVMETMTAMIYVAGSDSPPQSVINGAYLFNNVLYYSGSGQPANGYISLTGDTGTKIINNTIFGSASADTGGGLNIYGANTTFVNNVVNGGFVGLLGDPAATLASSNFNVLYNFGYVTTSYAGSTYTTLANWQAAPGSFDANSTNVNPVLNAGSSPIYQLTSTSSSAYRTGTNLTSSCGSVPALCTDAAGNARPASGAWDMGAYHFTSGGSPAPPRRLTVIIGAF